MDEYMAEILRKIKELCEVSLRNQILDDETIAEIRGLADALLRARMSRADASTEMLLKTFLGG
jgi:hypothetical protein